MTPIKDAADLEPGQKIIRAQNSHSPLRQPLYLVKKVDRSKQLVYLHTIAGANHQTQFLKFLRIEQDFEMRD